MGDVGPDLSPDCHASDLVHCPAEAAEVARGAGPGELRIPAMQPMGDTA